MPVMTSPVVDQKFQENWLEMYPHNVGQGSDPGGVDDSLTSLHWLQNFSILSADPERPPLFQQRVSLKRLGFPGPATDSPSSPPAGDTAATGMPQYLGSPVTSGSASTALFSEYPPGYPQVPVQAVPPAEVDYKSNPKVKPPYSYASLICMAMQASQQPKVTLSTIYSWITENFCYYRHAEPSWQNSIRHNLSLNKCFKKVPRRKDEPGKGGFWQIDPQYADMFVNGIFKRRRMPASHYNTQRQNKLFQGYHGVSNAAIYQRMSPKRRHMSPKTCRKSRTYTESPLLATETSKTHMLRGDFDLASVFDDVLCANHSTFEDLDINTALSSLGCEMEVSVQTSGAVGRWCGGGEVNNHHLSYSYVDQCAPPTDCSVNMGENHMPLQHLHQHLDQDHLQLQSHQQHFMHFDELPVLFCEASGEGQPWEGIKEEPEAIPVTLDQGFDLCDGFFAEMQAWETVERYL